MPDPVDRLSEIRARLGVTLRVFDEAEAQMPCNCPDGAPLTEQCRAAAVANLAGHELVADAGWLLEEIRQLWVVIKDMSGIDEHDRVETANPNDAVVAAAEERYRQEIRELRTLRKQRQAVLRICDEVWTDPFQCGRVRAALRAGDD